MKKWYNELNEMYYPIFIESLIGGVLMDGNYISKEAHAEFVKRIEAEDERQNSRIKLLEENVQHINALTLSVEKMAVNMGNMLEEQKKQGERLEKLEKEPADSYKQIKMAIITTVIGAVVGAIVGAVLVLL